ncbi:hypothetical protein AGRO_4034 [Agrobacterium sp. ATCC 31749]|nr:hypothetical protein AGRO_4034 [Agrobacterium sp. ATCC 31749]
MLVSSIISSFIGGPHLSPVHYIRAKSSPVAASGQQNSGL